MPWFGPKSKCRHCGYGPPDPPSECSEATLTVTVSGLPAVNDCTCFTPLGPFIADIDYTPMNGTYLAAIESDTEGCVDTGVWSGLLRAQCEEYGITVSVNDNGDGTFRLYCQVLVQQGPGTGVRSVEAEVVDAVIGHTSTHVETLTLKVNCGTADVTMDFALT